MPSLNRNIAHVVAWANLIQCMHTGPHTVTELHEETGLGLNTIRKLMTVMKRRKQVYVAAWERDSTPAGRHTIPAYAFGSRPDAARPPRQTSAQRSATRDRKKRLALMTMTVTTQGVQA